ncbi:hypothetical protein AGMMS49546_25740 [Spirochaetia bacterium]|nr:hypothetical protein AGMMS49546_25740 [Spirochaetia bacterium]
MIAEKDPDVRETVVTLKELSGDERNQMLADARMMKEWDEWGFRKEHYERGLKQGEASGYRRARVEAERKEYTAIKNFREMGLSFEQIARGMNSTPEEIEKKYRENPVNQ